MKGFLDLFTINTVVENYNLLSAKLQTSHNWVELTILKIILLE